MRLITPIFLVALALATSVHSFAQTTETKVPFYFIQVAAKDKLERSALAALGMNIEAVYSDRVWGFANAKEIQRIKSKGYRVLGTYDSRIARGGHENMFGYPSQDEKFHDYAETVTAMKQLEKDNPEYVRVFSIGKSWQGRDLVAAQVNSNPEARKVGRSGKPGVVIMGHHHAREHLSKEIPLMTLQYLMKNKTNETIKRYLDSRDIWFIPIVNPDGLEYDLAGDKYKMWRKNRRDNKDGTYGVDLNRNYGYKWGTGGSSSDTSSDVYMGPAPFSEPETAAIRNFISSHLNLKVVLSVHTFSELILYPWGYTYDPVAKAEDKAVYVKMATDMARYNRYTPQQSSELYIASGDTVDWAYGTHGMFAFTFELSPKSSWGGGGFYPGQGMIDKVFQDNLKPLLYLIDVADNPYKVIQGRAPRFSTGGRPIAGQPVW